jgi:phage recombination protein Bet
MNEIAVNEKKELAIIDENYVIESLKMLGIFGTLTKEQIKLACEVSKTYGLNPLKREVYFIPYGNKMNIITSYEVMIKKAEQTGMLDGWKVEYSDSDKKAICTIYRKDWKHPFTHEVYQNEVEQRSPLWQKMPKFMCKKVAVAQAFRMCFTNDLGGMPYTSDELPPEMTEIKQAERVEVKEKPPIIKDIKPLTVEKSDEIKKVVEQKEVLEPKQSEILIKDVKKATKKDVLDVVEKIKTELNLHGAEAMQFFVGVIGNKKATEVTVEDISKLTLAIEAKKNGK